MIFIVNEAGRTAKSSSMMETSQASNTKQSIKMLCTDVTLDL